MKILCEVQMIKKAILEKLAEYFTQIGLIHYDFTRLQPAFT